MRRLVAVASSAGSSASINPVAASVAVGARGPLNPTTNPGVTTAGSSSSGRSKPASRLPVPVALPSITTSMVGVSGSLTSSSVPSLVITMAAIVAFGLFPSLWTSSIPPSRVLGVSVFCKLAWSWRIRLMPMNNAPTKTMISTTMNIQVFPDGGPLPDGDEFPPEYLLDCALPISSSPIRTTVSL